MVIASGPCVIKYIWKQEHSDKMQAINDTQEALMSVSKKHPLPVNHPICWPIFFQVINCRTQWTDEDRRCTTRRVTQEKRLGAGHQEEYIQFVMGPFQRTVWEIVAKCRKQNRHIIWTALAMAKEAPLSFLSGYWTRV